MKNILTILIIAIAFSSIAQTIPEYTTIDKLATINIGMTENEVTTILGIPPYDVYHDVSNNCKVLVWHYRHKHHTIPSSQEDMKSSLKDGRVTYVKTDKVYFNFSENNKKLKSYFTDKGLEKSIDLIEMGRNLQEICDNPENLKMKNKGNDKLIIRSLNHHRYGAFFKLGLDKNPDGNSDILIGGQYRNIFKPFTNQKSISLDAKLLLNLTAKDEKTDDYWNDHLIISVPVYVCYNYRSWSLGAGLHLGIGNEGTGDDDNGQTGEKEGYDNFLSVPVLKLGYNLYDKINIEYNQDLSKHGQGSIGVGYYWNF